MSTSAAGRVLSRAIRDIVEIAKGRKLEETVAPFPVTATRYLQIDDLRPGARHKYTSGTGVLVTNDDLIIAWDGANAGIVGYGLSGAIGSTLARLRIIDPQVDTRYLGRFLQTQFRHLQANATGATIPHVNRTALESIEVPLPPLAEQRRIADILDKTDAIRRKHATRVELLQQFPRACFAVQFGDLISAHRGWTLHNLSELVREGTEVTYGIVQCGPQVPEGIPYIRTSDMTCESLQAAGMGRTSREIASKFKRSEVRQGELVFAIRASVGAVHIVPPELDGANLTQGTARIAPSDAVNPVFLLWALRSVPVQRWVDSQCKGTTFREITLGRLRELPLALPPRGLQEAFSSLVVQSEKLLSPARCSLAEATNLFHSLVQRAFRGEL